MIRVFISQPMNGKTDKQIMDARREAAIDAIKRIHEEYGVREDIEVMHTVFDFSNNVHPLVYLGKSIEMMGDADIVYFARGWDNARGCVIEHECANRYGKNILYHS